MSNTTIHHRIYNNLNRLIPGLEEHLEQGTESGKSVSKPFMDLHYNYLRKDERGHVISLTHYFESNGDLVPDPDMEIRIDIQQKTSEALTFQNQFVFDEVYERGYPNHYSPKLKRDLNEFLLQWTRNARHQGHSIELNVPEKEIGESPEQEIQPESVAIETANPANDLAQLRDRNNEQSITR